jgi:hypothetical protein
MVRRSGPEHTHPLFAVVRYAHQRRSHDLATDIAARSTVASRHGTHGVIARTVAGSTTARRPGPVHTLLLFVVVRYAQPRKRHEPATDIAARSTVASPHGAHGTPAPTVAASTMARRPGPVPTPLLHVVVRYARPRKKREPATDIAA